MSRNNASLLDIVRAGQLIVQFAHGIDREQLALDLRTQSAILYQIAVRACLKSPIVCSRTLEIPLNPP